MKTGLLIVVAVALTHFCAACSTLSRAGQDAKSKQGANSKPDANAPVERVVIDEGPKDWEPYRRLLFVDQTLEEMVGEYGNSQRDGDDPFVSALKHKREGRAGEAKKSLKRVLNNPEAEVREKLWAWRALGELGEKPPAGEGDKARGVVLEVPVESGDELWVDTLAAYSDGRVRYLNGTGKLIVWEAPGDERISPLAVSLVETAQRLVGKNRRVEKHLPLSNRVIRISVLTFDGIHVAELTEAGTTEDTDAGRAYRAGTRLFLTLLEEQQKSDDRR